jgi:hypothetical protein
MPHEVRQAIDQLRGRGHQLWNTMLRRRRAHMLHIGKTGGTALKAALRLIPAWRITYSLDWGWTMKIKSSHGAGDGRKNLLLQLHRHRSTLRDVPVGDKVFFFVRDPVARFISAFNSRKRQGQPRYVKPWNAAEAEAFARFETPNALGGALASSNPSLRSAAENAMRGITHVQTSYWDWFEDQTYFESRLNDILFIGFQETLSEDFEVVKSLLNIPPYIRLPVDDVTSHRSPPGFDRTLDEAAQGALREWYARDLDFIKLCRCLRSRWLRHDLQRNAAKAPLAAGRESHAPRSVTPRGEAA